MTRCIDTGGIAGHTGFVADVIGGTLVTIEGNTNNGGGREGIGVFQRSRRKISDIKLGLVALAQPMSSCATGNWATPDGSLRGTVRFAARNRRAIASGAQLRF